MQTQPDSQKLQSDEELSAPSVIPGLFPAFIGLAELWDGT